MKKHILTLLATLTILLITAQNLLAINGNMGGPTQDGSADFPYLIEDFNDFQAFCNDPNYWAAGVNTKLMCNIDLDGHSYTTAIIAPDTNNANFDFDGISFQGVFDGNSHIISDLFIDTQGAGNDYLGLFGNISSTVSEIKNLGITEVEIIGGNRSTHLGALCGSNGGSFRGRITNCYSHDGSITIGDYGGNVGGLCGRNEGYITACYSDCSVTGGFRSIGLGGLCGKNENDLIDCHATGDVLGGQNSYALGGLSGRSFDDSVDTRNCYATGSVTSGDNSTHIGGLCGDNFQGEFENCHSTGAVEGGSDSEYVGGLCGWNNGGYLINCYAIGSVHGGNGSDNFGGLCGSNDYGIITNCYANGTVETGYASMNIGGLCGDNSGKTTNCYVTGRIIASYNSENIGALCGSNDAILTNCFWDIETTCYGDGIGNMDPDPNDVTSKTTTEMKTAATFLDADWDLVNVWNVEEGQTYPLLRKYSAFDTNYDNKVNFIDFADFANNWLAGAE